MRIAFAILCGKMNIEQIKLGLALVQHIWTSEGQYFWNVGFTPHQDAAMPLADAVGGVEKQMELNTNRVRLWGLS